MITFKKIIFISVALVLYTAAMPVKNIMPAELSATIEKKWPGSNTVLAPLHPEPDKNTIFYKIIQSNSIIGWAYTRRVFSCRNGGCNDQSSMAEESVSHEYFDYFALLNPDYSILEIKVYNYAATHGQEICSKAWLKQFKGFDGSSKLRYGKDIDAISGATISGKAITEDVATTLGMIRR